MTSNFIVTLCEMSQHKPTPLLFQLWISFQLKMSLSDFY